MALAQDTDLLLVDEPTTYLNLAHQIEILELLRDLNITHGRTIVMVLHDLNQAAQYADHLISIVKGKIYQEGPPKKGFTTNMVKEVFGLERCLIENPVDQTPLCVPIGRSLRSMIRTKTVAFKMQRSLFIRSIHMYK